MGRPASTGNRLLTALPSADLALLGPHLQKVSLEQDAVVIRAGDRRGHVYFPHSGAISSWSAFRTEKTIANCGNRARRERSAHYRCWDPSFLSSVTAVVRVGRHRIANLRVAVHCSPTWRAAPSDMWSKRTRGRYSCSSSTSQPATDCNSVEARMARWLASPARHLRTPTDQHNILH